MKVPVSWPSNVTGMRTVCPASRASDWAGLGRSVVSPPASRPSRLTTTTDLNARELATSCLRMELSEPMSLTVKVSTNVSATPIRALMRSANRELTSVRRRSSMPSPAESASRAAAIANSATGTAAHSPSTHAMRLPMRLVKAVQPIPLASCTYFPQCIHTFARRLCDASAIGKLCAEWPVAECALFHGTHRLDARERLYGGISVALYAAATRSRHAGHCSSTRARRDRAKQLSLAGQKGIDQRRESGSEQLEWPDLAAPTQKQTGLQDIEAREADTHQRLFHLAFG